MFKNRKITVTVDKKDKDETQVEHNDPFAFERKATFVLHHTKRLGAYMFAGVCVYVLLDTYRQVQVANASQPTE